MKKIIKQAKQQDFVRDDSNHAGYDLSDLQHSISYIEGQLELSDLHSLIRFIPEYFKDISELTDYYESYHTEALRQYRIIREKSLELFTLLNNLKSYADKRIDLLNSVEVDSSKRDSLTPVDLGMKKTIDNNQEF
jgi:hypothetical protein